MTFRLIIKKVLFLFLLLALRPYAFTQKSVFASFNVEQGLGQSQATSIAQDELHNLWIAHLGGISRFDGKNFTTYTTQDGMQSNFNNTILIDKNQNVWTGSHIGFSVFNGKKFRNYNLNAKGKASVVSSLQLDSSNHVWALYDGKLYKADVDKYMEVISPFPHKRVLALGNDGNGDILAVIENTGIYIVQNNQWRLLANTPLLSDGGWRFRKIYAIKSKIFFLTNKGIYSLEQGNIQRLNLKDEIQTNALCLFEDKRGFLWVGTSKGAYRINEKETIHFNYAKGFTNHAVYDIKNDAEGNIWFATIGSGLLKYIDDRITYFDKELLYHIGVSGIAKTSDGAIWFGTYGGGLRKYDGKTLTEHPIPSKNTAGNIINFCVADKKGGLWIGTQGGGLWYHLANNFTNISEKFQSGDIVFYSGDIDEQGRMLFATAQGIYFYENDSFQKVPGFATFANTAKFIGKDSVLVGTPQGVILYAGKMVAPFPTNADMATATVLSIKKKDETVFVGTADKGLFMINLVSKKIYQYTTKDGLSSNCIYDLVIDSQKHIWLSTGFYLNHLKLNHLQKVKSVSIIAKSKGILSAEGNTNSIYLDNGKIWLGTINGLNIIKVDSYRDSHALPRVVLTDVKLFSLPITQTKYYDSIGRFYPVPVNLRLPHQKNHLTFEYRAISLVDPDDIQFEYMIEGLDKEFLNSTRLNQVVYSSIPPGEYTFAVRAVDSDGKFSATEKFRFEIIAPLYQRWYFKAFVILFLIAAALSINRLRSRWKEKRIKELEILKEEEQLKVRTKTAEDFHDDIGNKLTRINVLTEVLKNKLHHTQEAKGLITQIQESTNSLYSSSKDLIWSLSNEYGTLYDQFARLIAFGTGMFQNTQVDFEYSGNSEAFRKVNLDYNFSRNLTLIFKEAMNNTLKYADATTVSLSFACYGEGNVRVQLKDDGTGFTLDNPKKGYGLNNMKNRAERIHADLIINTSPGNGTTVTLQFKIP